MNDDTKFTVRSGFREEWNNFFFLLKYSLFREELSSSDRVFEGLYSFAGYDHTRRILAVLEKIITVDTEYMERERPNRRNGADCHESFLRSYLFEGKNPGSPLYREIYDELRAVLYRIIEIEKRGAPYDDEGQEGVAKRFMNLESKWEQVHVGLKFVEYSN